METLELHGQSTSEFANEASDFFEGSENEKIAQDILNIVFQFRRTAGAHTSCDQSCSFCQSPHLNPVISAIAASKPVTFVLPAFPGKSPNLAKVLSPLPDMAERLALQFLDKLCEHIREVYSPGAQIILCSDGRVFSDIIGMNEADVSAYQLELDAIIQELGLANLSTFNLDETFRGKDFVQMRHELMQSYGASQESLREKVLRDSEAERMYCGITRFLVEDSTFPGQTKSRTAIQKESKAKAYEVIRRSNAWSEFIAQRFTNAVRLSIHPQACGSKKIGIRLIGTESWMTPWHGVAVRTDSGFTLLKRSEAETLGARLVFTSQGRASHFELAASQAMEAR